MRRWETSGHAGVNSNTEWRHHSKIGYPGYPGTKQKRLNFSTTWYSHEWYPVYPTCMGHKGGRYFHSEIFLVANNELVNGGRRYGPAVAQAATYGEQLGPMNGTSTFYPRYSVVSLDKNC